jgi:hypothetical protein
MVEIRYSGDELWDRIERAIESVKIRMRRVSALFEAAGIPFAVVGGNAVQLWVAQVDESAVRNTRDVDVVINRADFARVKEVLEGDGFIYRPSPPREIFLDGPAARPWDAVHLFIADERCVPNDEEPLPSIADRVKIQSVWTLPLEVLVRMKLIVFRLKDRVHLRDMMDVGLIDAGWLERFPPQLSARLKELLDDPDG